LVSGDCLVYILNLGRLALNGSESCELRIRTGQSRDFEEWPSFYAG